MMIKDLNQRLERLARENKKETETEQEIIRRWQRDTFLSLSPRNLMAQEKNSVKGIPMRMGLSRVK